MPDNKQTAQKKINDKWNALKQKGVNLRNSISDVLDAGYGGWYQIFERGRIYSHHSVGTYEVHGNVLLAYLAREAMGHNPRIGRREFGFPTSDETRTEDGLYAMSQFEWGQIINVKGAWGSVGISGEIYKHWKNNNLLSQYGYPINGNVLESVGELVYFERGVAFYNKEKHPAPIFLPLRIPLLGNPAILHPDDKSIPIQLYTDYRKIKKMGGYSVFKEFIRDRFYLEEVGTKRRILLRANGMRRLPTRPGSPASSQETLVFALEKDKSLVNRVLYNIVFKMDHGHYFPLSPHAIYVKDSWENFGLLHATDIHVSRRIDGFRKKLFRTKMKENTSKWDDAIDKLNNWNDRFRDLIKYANHLYRKGELDGIIATGDLVDYLFEDGENRQGGGNFEFFKDIVLGKIKYPYADKHQEELNVPIFTTLGNHDYRINAYRLHQKLDLPWPLSNRLIPQYKGFNLEEKEAEIVDGYHFISTDEGKRQLKIENPFYYFKYFSGSGSYVVKLGKHYIVMIDSGSDTNIPSDWDAFFNYFGYGSEDNDTFLNGTPNCKGYQGADIRLISETLNTVENDGLVIIGTHAPPINTARTEYPHYFRETEHPDADELEIANYLRRVGKIDDDALFLGLPNNVILHRAKNAYGDWAFSETSYFKTGDHKDHFLDWGVSRGFATEFLELCAGKDMARPVDLILFGHVHTRAELRIRWNREANPNRMEYFHDYYTQNPDYYYICKKYKGNNNKFDSVRLDITKRASLNESPYKDEIQKDVLVLNIPPYSDPLDKSSNPVVWWAKHRPLFIQGAPLGPMDNEQRLSYPGLNDQNFQGAKLIKVTDNVISKITQVPAHQMSLIEPKVGKLYYFISKSSQLSLSIHGDITANNTPVQQLKYEEKTHQIWRLEAVNDVSDYFYIVSINSNKCLTVKGPSKGIGNQIVSYEKQDPETDLNLAQQWQIQPTNDGYYNIQNRYSNQLLQPHEGFRSEKTNIVQNLINESPAQKWKIVEIKKSSYNNLPPVPGRDYFIKPSFNDLSLDISRGSMNDEAPIVQWTHHGGDNQVWRLEAVPEIPDFYYIVSKKSNKCLTSISPSYQARGQVVQRSKQPDDNMFPEHQLWYLKPVDDSYYFISNLRSRLYLDVKQGSKKEGTEIWDLPHDGSLSQKWRFVVDENSQNIPKEHIEGDAVFNFRSDFPSSWNLLTKLDLQESLERYYSVDFTISRDTFPNVLSDFKIAKIAVEFVTENGLPPMAMELSLGNKRSINRMTYDGKVNSWSGEDSERWKHMIGQSPIGTWNLAVPHNDTVWGWFKEGIIKNILLTISYEAIRG